MSRERESTSVSTTRVSQVHEKPRLGINRAKGSSAVVTILHTAPLLIVVFLKHDPGITVSSETDARYGGTVLDETFFFYASSEAETAPSHQRSSSPRLRSLDAITPAFIPLRGAGASTKAKYD
jgi:hypothetical protein